MSSWPSPGSAPRRAPWWHAIAWPVGLAGWAIWQVLRYLAGAGARTQRSLRWLGWCIVAYVGYWLLVGWLANTTTLRLFWWIRRSTAHNTDQLVYHLHNVDGWPPLHRVTGWWIDQSKSYDILHWGSVAQPFFWLRVFTIPLLLIAPLVLATFLVELVPRRRP